MDDLTNFDPEPDQGASNPPEVRKETAESVDSDKPISSELVVGMGLEDLPQEAAEQWRTCVVTDLGTGESTVMIILTNQFMHFVLPLDVAGAKQLMSGLLQASANVAGDNAESNN